MPVELDVRIEQPVLSTLEALRVTCTLRNTGDAALTIPSPYDRSGSLQLGLFNARGEALRMMDRQTRQFMMTDGRVDASLDLDTLGAGQSWTWDMDLASYHFPIPPGDYLLGVVYAFEPEQLHVEWGPQPLRVTESPLTALTVVRDNPIIDGLTLLMQSQGATGPEYFLRLHNYPRPLAAWWSARVLLDEMAEAPFCATADFFQTESSDWFHRKWVVWQGPGGTVCAQCKDRGDTVLSRERAGARREGMLPDGARLIRAALCSLNDELFVFCWNRAGRIECHALRDRQLEARWELDVPFSSDTMLSIAGDDRGMHIVAGWRGLHYMRVDADGQMAEQRQLFRTRLTPHAIQCEISEQRVKGLFAEGGSGKVVHLAVYNLASSERRETYIERMPLSADLTELAFDQDRAGRFHLLVATSARRLYYYSEGRGPVLIAAGEERFFPVIAAPQQIYFGLYRREHGYRFAQYQRRRQGSKMVGLDAHA